MSKEYKSQCLCGAIEYNVKGPFIRFFLCHCSRCRKASGAPHSANLFTRAKNVIIAKGMENIQRYDLPQAENFARAFCKKCGSPVPYTSRDGRVCVVPAGSLTDFDDRKVDAHVFYHNRTTWYETSLNSVHKEDG